MFTIVCGTCAARLKVRKVALIGQTLACPRCGEMLRVVAPEGFVPPPSEVENGSSSGSSVASSGASDGSDSLFSDFDEIEKVIERELAGQKTRLPGSPVSGAAADSAPVAVPPPGGARRGVAGGRADGKVERASRPAPASAGEPATGANGAAQSPLAMPPNRAAANQAFVAAHAELKKRAESRSSGETAEPANRTALPSVPDWTSQQAQQKRRYLLVGLVVFVAAGLGLAIWFAFQPGAGSTEIAQKPAEGSGSPSETAGDANKPEPAGKVEKEPGTEGTGENQTDPQKAAAPDTGGSDANQEGPEPSGTDPSAMATQSEGDGPPPLPGLEGPAAAVDAATEKTPLPGEKSADPQEPNATDRELPARPDGIVRPPGLLERLGPEAQAGQLSTAPDTRLNPFGEFGALLAEQGISMSATERAAAGAVPEIFSGIPAVVMARPDPVPLPNLDAVLELPVGKIAYQQVAQMMVLKELSHLAGTPIAWDLRAMVDAGLDPMQKINLEIRNGTLGDAIREACKAGGLEMVPADWGIAVIPAGDRETVTRNLSVAGASDDAAAERAKQLAEALPMLFAPGTWGQADNGFRITATGASLEVVHNQRTARAIGRLVDELNGLARDPATSVRIPAFLAATPSLDRERNFKPRFDAPLEEYLADLGRQEGLAVLVDWSVVGAAGWNLQTTVPGHLTAVTARELLDQLCQSMSLEWQAIGPELFLITTAEASRNSLDVSVFPVHDLLGKSLEPDAILAILSRATAGKVPAGAWTHVYHDEAARAVVVAAPPVGLKLVAAVLDSLRDPARAAAKQ